MSHRSYLTILVIDDCAEDREIYHQYLQQDTLYKHNILEFQTAKQAIAWCQQQIPDVILLDYLLPDDDGLGFLQKLRENLNNSQSAVIMLTGQGDETIAVRAMKNGAQDYLVKNYLTPEILQSAIHHAVELKLLTQQLEQSRQQQQMMAAIALRIRQSLNLEEILTVTAAEVRQFLQTDRVVIYQFQPDMSGTVVAESILPGWTVAMGAGIQDDCFKDGAGADYHQGKKRAIDDINQAGLTPCHLQLLEQFEVKACLIVPILVTNKLWGLLIVHQCTAPRHWELFELDLLDQLGVQIAIAIQQASAYQQAQAELQERKRVEAALRESEQRFRQMADTAPVLIWMAGLDKACYYFNKRWLEFTGKTLEAEVGDGWAQGVHPDELQDCLDTYVNAFDARQHFQMEYRLKRFDGEYRWILDTGTPRFTSEGEFLGYISSCVDISDRKQVEQALRKNEERLTMALEAARMGNWDWNITTGEVHWSANLEKLFGMVPGTFDGQYETVMTMIHPDDRESVLLAINRAVYEREDYNLEFRFIKLDGTLRWALSKGRVFYDQKGHPVRMSGVDKDITERKQAEVALKESEARFQAFMNNSPAASWITDANGRMLYLSQTYLRTFQLPSEKLEDVIGKTVFEVYPTEIAQQFLDNIRQVAETQQILETIELAPKPDGTVGDFLVYKFPLPGTTKPLMIGGIAVDISDKICAEQALQQLNLELEARVEERTAALRESEERWHLALRGSNDGIWDWNIKTSEVFFSARWEEMLGFAENELIHNFEAWSNRIHLDDRDRIMKVLADHLAHKTPFFQEEYQIKCKDSSYIWILDRGQALWDEFGNAIRMSGSATDISKRKQTEAALLAVTRLKQAILASIDYAIISTNSEGIIQTFNLAAQKMLGYTADEVIGKLTINRFYDPEELKQFPDALSREMGKEIYFEDLSMLKTQQDSCEVEWTFIRKDGSRFPVALSVKPLCNLEGQIIGGVGIAKDITQQKQIEAQLRKNAANLESAQRIANLGSWELDLQTQQLIWSEEVFRIFGRNPESGTPSYNEMLHYIHPDDRDRRDFVLLQAMEQRQPYEIEYRFYRADGSLGYLLSRGEFILDINDQPCQLIGTILDITKRKQTEEQLRNLSDRLTLALKSANIGIWDWDMIQDAEWDDRMYELYDLQRSDGVAVYQDWVNRLHPDDLVLAETSFQDAVLGIKEFDTEFRIILSDGSIRFIKASALVQRNEQGEPQRMVGINYDITDRKQAEVALRESEHRYATLTEAAPVAIFRLDAASNCIYVNERWGLMTGKPTAAALGKGWLENIHLEDCDRLLIDWSDPCEQRCRLHETCRQEVRYLRPDGCITWFYMQIVPETNPSGTLIGYIGTLTDITIRKEIESEVNHHRDLREAIFNESADALFLVDSDTQLIFDCNHRAVELFEVSEKEELMNIQGNTLQRYEFTPQELDEIVQEVNHKSWWSREIEYATRKGNFFWGNLAAQQINVAGKVINLVRLSDISERKKAVEQIQRSLEEKETLLKEIHHRVKNNLQIISSLLRMQSRRSGDETTLLMFKESQDRVQSMALIHEQLYQSADICEINFDNYIKSLIDSLFRSYGVSQKNIVLNIETNGIKLPLDTAIPCGLIINELVSNCLKYAFPEKKEGNITISLQQSPENQLVLVVQDTGIGIPETLDWENSNSLGLRIVKNLVRQLKGNILLEGVGVDRISLQDALASLLPQSSTTKLSYHPRHCGTTFYINFPQ
ncbi:PAS domain S-box protein [Nostoc sp. C052]|uniref:PAS domain S-box protein n=1 Tax=Nostoc sp. C052 TaxID=2576902 RepID=UPI0015C2FB19|nr:PAS domain S-box protein [Nostoc sp. C052]QLE43852.1 PAS domain S-box protein [Nostoc sp. C052]